MVQKSCLSQIVSFIDVNNLVAMKPWSQRYKREKRTNIRCSNSWNMKLIEQVRKILQLISGNDFIAMLKGITC